MPTMATLFNALIGEPTSIIHILNVSMYFDELVKSNVGRRI